MSEIGELPPQTPKEPLLNIDILRTTFSHPTFQSHLVQLAHHAHLNLSEGGFSVQNINGTPVISDLIKSRRMGSVQDSWESLSTSTNSLYEHDDDEMVDEIEDAEKYSFYVKYKPNIFLSIHSHPALKKEATESALRPSRQDLEVWDSERVLGKNQYLIDGIFVKNGNVGLLFLFQVDPSKPQTNEYQQWNGRHRQELVRLFKESGIRYETLEFDIKQKKFTDQELDKLNTFVVNQ